MELEKAVLVATQFFRFWQYKWTKLDKENDRRFEYVPNSDEITDVYEKLREDALKTARKRRGHVGEAESGRLLVTCIIHEGDPYFEYYIAAN